MDSVHQLDNVSIARYSRQLILPEIGVVGQAKLKKSSVLIVGAGGLGCPAAVYLAAAGVGFLGVVDFDDVELNNLHRQILHTESRIGTSKCASATTACTQLNSNIKCIPYKVQLNSSNAMDIIKQYDIVVDATDNVATRYLLNDACVLAGKPLVSGSALRFEGQLTVYNYKGGPCYRCLYPNPPPPHTVTNCSDGGVLGVVPGIIGSMQALEVIKIITEIGSSYSEKLLVFDGLDCSFRQIKLRPRQTNCVVCGDKPTITQLIDYEQFCGARATDKIQNVQILSNDQRLSCKQYAKMVNDGDVHILLDVRQQIEVDICHLPSMSLNIHLDKLNSAEHMEKIIQKVNEIRGDSPDTTVPIVVVCHRGNDSQRGACILLDRLKQLNVDVKDIAGGLEAWSQTVDTNFPRY